MIGPCSDRARQSLASIALEVEGGSMRARPRLLSDVGWDEEPMRWTSHHLSHADLGDPEGVLTCDASGFPTKSQDSVGVARPSCGTRGKFDHGQVGVFAV